MRGRGSFVGYQSWCTCSWSVTPKCPKDAEVNFLKDLVPAVSRNLQHFFGFGNVLTGSGEGSQLRCFPHLSRGLWAAWLLCHEPWAGAFKMFVPVSSWIKLEGTGYDMSCHGEALYYKGTSFDVLPFPSPILVPQLAKMSSGRVGELQKGVVFEAYRSCFWTQMHSTGETRTKAEKSNFSYSRSSFCCDTSVTQFMAILTLVYSGASLVRGSVGSRFCMIIIDHRKFTAIWQMYDISNLSQRRKCPALKLMLLLDVIRVSKSLASLVWISIAGCLSGARGVWSESVAWCGDYHRTLGWATQFWRTPPWRRSVKWEDMSSLKWRCMRMIFDYGFYCILLSNTTEPWQLVGHSRWHYRWPCDKQGHVNVFSTLAFMQHLGFTSILRELDHLYTKWGSTWIILDIPMTRCVTIWWKSWMFDSESSEVSLWRAGLLHCSRRAKVLWWKSCMAFTVSTGAL